MFPPSSPRNAEDKGLSGARGFRVSRNIRNVLYLLPGSVTGFTRTASNGLSQRKLSGRGTGSSTRSFFTAALSSAALPSAELASAELPSAALPAASLPSAALPSAALTSAALPSAALPFAALPSEALPSATFMFQQTIGCHTDEPP